MHFKSQNKKKEIKDFLNTFFKICYLKILVARQVLLQAVLEDLAVRDRGHIFVDFDLMHFVIATKGYGGFDAIT